MSDKFFDKDNNFILWKDKGDLTEASKYVGESRGFIGIGESLATKIVKGKVDIDRTYGEHGVTDSTYTEVGDSFTVNWGKCGGASDVKVTYNVGEPLWIPNAFLAQAYDPSTKAVYGNTASVYGDGSVGYYCKDTMSNTNHPCAIYVLPQELGAWLYESAEDCKTTTKYNVSNDVAQNRIYKGIAIYPDHIGSDNSASWEGSDGWGVGIRKGSDIDYIGWMPRENYCQRVPSSQGLSHYDADTYYLVMQCSEDPTYKGTLQGMLTAFNLDDTGSEHIWLRRTNTMTSVPSSTNLADKYTVPSDMELLTVHPTLPTPNEDQVVIDWGGGIKTYYKYGEPMYVPRAFLMEGFDNTGYPMPNRAVTGSGYVGFADSDSATGDCLSVYKLPQELGEYLYNRAESTPTTGRYGSTSDPSYRIYRGIAIYSDTLVSGKNWNESDSWGIGIRKKSDLDIAGHNSDGTLYRYPLYTYTAIKEFMDDSSYYLVTQSTKNLSTTTTSFTYQWLQCFPKDEPVWMRSFKDMTSKPSATNMGKKMVYHPEYYALPLGGKIFYIDPTDNGVTYTFFDASGNIVSGSTVADYANAVSYVVDGTPSKDKFYVYYPTKYGDFKWGYFGATYGAEGTIIGTGKTNTRIVLSNGNYPNNCIWVKLLGVRESSGLSDLYIPSKGELEAFITANLENWHRNTFLWSSSEATNKLAWIWWYSTNKFSDSRKDNGESVFFIRSF